MVFIFYFPELFVNWTKYRDLKSETLLRFEIRISTFSFIALLIYLQKNVGSFCAVRPIPHIAILLQRGSAAGCISPLGRFHWRFSNMVANQMQLCYHNQPRYAVYTYYLLLSDRSILHILIRQVNSKYYSYFCHVNSTYSYLSGQLHVFIFLFVMTSLHISIRIGQVNSTYFLFIY